MAKVACKGTVLQQEIASVYTAVAQVISLDISGSQTETYDATTLDTSGSGKEYAPTGYAETPDINGEVFYDPALAGHQAMTDLIATPAAQNWKVIYADSGTTEQILAGAGFGFDVTVDMADGLKGSFSIKTTGSAGWST